MWTAYLPTCVSVRSCSVSDHMGYKEELMVDWLAIIFCIIGSAALILLSIVGGST